MRFQFMLTVILIASAFVIWMVFLCATAPKIYSFLSENKIAIHIEIALLILLGFLEILALMR